MFMLILAWESFTQSEFIIMTGIAAAVTAPELDEVTMPTISEVSDMSYSFEKTWPDLTDTTNPNSTTINSCM